MNLLWTSRELGGTRRGRSDRMLWPRHRLPHKGCALGIEGPRTLWGRLGPGANLRDELVTILLEALREIVTSRPVRGCWYGVLRNSSP